MVNQPRGAANEKMAEMRAFLILYFPQDHRPLGHFIHN